MSSPKQGVIRVTAHPPERARRGAPVILPCGCCCCCCCCLHTVGGLVGGVVGSVAQIRPHPKPIDPDFPFRCDELEEEAPVVPPSLLYWLLLSFLIAVTAVWYYLSSSGRGVPFGGNPSELLIGLFVAVLILPGLQLGASVLAVLSIALFYGEKATPLLRVGKITLWSFVGALAGMLIMSGCCGLLYVGNR
jgi:hypothetical protein